MTYTNESGGNLKEKGKNAERYEQNDEHRRPITTADPTTRSEPARSWMKWVTLLQTRLRDCPTDTLTRCPLASL
jgi:hypothetical protein